jgi:hypothetical protein
LRDPETNPPCSRRTAVDCGDHVLVIEVDPVSGGSRPIYGGSVGGEGHPVHKKAHNHNLDAAVELALEWILP